MPAKGWKKDEAKSQVLKLRVEPEFAARVVAEAGERDGSVSDALRTAALVGLDALDRRRKGLGADGRLRVELTPEEEALRDEQRRFAEEALRRQGVQEETARKLGERVVVKLQGGSRWYTELLYATGAAGHNDLRRALRLLTDEGRIRVVQINTGKGVPQAQVYALADPLAVATPVPPPPSIRRVMDEVLAVVGAARTGVATKAELRRMIVVDPKTLGEALARLLADGWLRRTGLGVYIGGPRLEGERQDPAGDAEAVASPAPSGAEVGRPAGSGIRRGGGGYYWDRSEPTRLVSRKPSTTTATERRSRPLLLGREMTEEEFAVLQAVVDGSEATIPEVMEATGQDRAMVARRLKRLTAASLVVRVGPKGAGPGRCAQWGAGALGRARVRETIQ